MLTRLIFVFGLLLAGTARAEPPDIAAIVDNHVLPGFRTFADKSQALSAAAEADCAPSAPELRSAYGTAFDAWIAVSHLRFGPTETADRAFSLAFWPDSRGKTPKTLGALIDAADPALTTAEGFSTVSIAARGFYALEFLLYDPAFAERGSADYRCALVRAMAADVARNAADILEDWQANYADLLRHAGANDDYRSPEEAAKRLLTALSTGLEFTSDMRLGRPMGTFERPRPKRAEARRSGRSLRHVVLSLEATRDLARLLAAPSPDAAEALEASFGRALKLASQLGDPVFAGVAEPQGRFEVEALKQAVDDVRDAVTTRLGPALGVAAGFNSLDGD
ncbi:imelysin family protein [Oricola sp.]|uniref:imelysin family protein n=1 Tax=Oricola sp. TaxID=1979950 RepID=UPI003BAAAAE9